MLHSIDVNGFLVSVSNTWLAKLGYSREEVLGRRSVDFMTAESRHRAINTVLPAFFRTGRCDEQTIGPRRSKGRIDGAAGG